MEDRTRRFGEALGLLTFKLHTRDTRSFWQSFCFYLDTQIFCKNKLCAKRAPSQGCTQCPGDQQGVTKMKGLRCSSEAGHRPPDTWTAVHRFPEYLLWKQDKEVSFLRSDISVNRALHQQGALIAKLTRLHDSLTV